MDRCRFKPTCVFQAEEITLTIGQAFELAYKNYLDTSGKEAEQQKQQKKISNIERENTLLKSRLKELATLKDVKAYMTEKKVRPFPYFLHNVFLQSKVGIFSLPFSSKAYTGRFRRLGRCFIDWASAVVGECDTCQLSVSFTYLSGGPI